MKALLVFNIIISMIGIIIVSYFKTFHYYSENSIDSIKPNIEIVDSVKTVTDSINLNHVEH